VPISPQSPRRQRKAVYTATTFERRRRMTVPLSRELRRRFGRRNLPLRKGDTVRVMSGSYVGREERVAKIDRRAYSVTLDNVTLKTGEEKLKPLPIRTSYLVITRLNLADAWRRRSLKVREEEVTAEERGEGPTAAEGEDVTPEPTTKAAPARPDDATPEDETDDDADDADEDEEDDDEADETTPPAKPPPRRRSATKEESA
jgi:large subunit ribosomal protein L24